GRVVAAVGQHRPHLVALQPCLHPQVHRCARVTLGSQCQRPRLGLLEHRGGDAAAAVVRVHTATEPSAHVPLAVGEACAHPHHGEGDQTVTVPDRHSVLGGVEERGGELLRQVHLVVVLTGAVDVGEQVHQLGPGGQRRGGQGLPAQCHPVTITGRSTPARTRSRTPWAGGSTWNRTAPPGWSNQAGVVSACTSTACAAMNTTCAAPGPHAEGGNERCCHGVSHR